MGTILARMPDLTTTNTDPFGIRDVALPSIASIEM